MSSRRSLMKMKNNMETWDTRFNMKWCRIVDIKPNINCPICWERFSSSDNEVFCFSDRFRVHKIKPTKNIEIINYNLKAGKLLLINRSKQYRRTFVFETKWQMYFWTKLLKELRNLLLTQLWDNYKETLSNY